MHYQALYQSDFILFDIIIAITVKQFSYRFTTRYATATPIRKSRTQNALRIPLNLDVIFFSVTVAFITKKQKIDVLDIEIYVCGYKTIIR